MNNSWVLDDERRIWAGGGNVDSRQDDVYIYIYYEMNNLSAVVQKGKVLV